MGKSTDMDAPSAAPGGDAYSVIYAVVHAFGLDRFLPVLLALHLLASALDAAVYAGFVALPWRPAEYVYGTLHGYYLAGLTPAEGAEALFAVRH